MTQASATELVISPEQFLEHWQGHRALTRRVIDAFPDDKLFTHSIGGMRTFSSFAMEFLGMAVPTLHGVVTGEWKSFESPKATTKADLLKQWDDAYGIDIYMADTDTIRLRLKRLPPDLPAFAKEVYAFCPDIVDQGMGSVEALEQAIRESREVYLWWD